MTLTCKSVGGNPNSSVSWYRENVLINEDWADNQNNVTLKFETGGKFYDDNKYSLLQMNWTVKKEDDGVIFSCKSWNPKLEDGEKHKIVESRTMDVRCEWIIS